MSFQLDSNQVRIVAHWLLHQGYEGVRYETMNYSEMNKGVNALFFPLDENTGVKFYHKPHVGKMTYYWHRILSKFGVVPEAWGLGSVWLYGHEVVYFMTERCKVLCEYEHSGEGYNQVTNVIRRVRERMKKHMMLTDGDGLRGGAGNYGILRGKAVLIDLGYIAYITPREKYLLQEIEPGDERIPD